MGLFDFNATEKSVCSAYAKLTGISLIAGVAMALGGMGVMAIAEKAEDKSNITRARDSLAEQLSSAKDNAEKYKQMYFDADRTSREAHSKLMQLQIENRRLEERLKEINSTKATEGLGD